MFMDASNSDLSSFLREAAAYFRKRDTHGEDSAFWANEANAERCEIAADRLASSAPLHSQLANCHAEIFKLREQLLSYAPLSETKS